MRRPLIVTGVLGSGTALVFAAAALAAALFPNGAAVPAGWGGAVGVMRGGVMIGGPVQVDGVRLDGPAPDVWTRDLPQLAKPGTGLPVALPVPEAQP